MTAFPHRAAKTKNKKGSSFKEDPFSVLIVSLRKLTIHSLWKTHALVRSYETTTRRFGSVPMENVVTLGVSWSAVWMTWRS